MVDLNVDPPRASEKLRNLVESIAEYVIEGDPERKGDEAPTPVLSPAKMAVVYEKVAGYNSTYKGECENVIITGGDTDCG